MWQEWTLEIRGGMVVTGGGCDKMDLCAGAFKEEPLFNIYFLTKVMNSSDGFFKGLVDPLLKHSILYILIIFHT